MERGNKVFRYGGWESARLYDEVLSKGLHDEVPVQGFFSGGAFCQLDESNGKNDGPSSSGDGDNIDDKGITDKTVHILETDSVYAVLTKAGTGTGAGTGENDMVGTSTTIGGDRDKDSDRDSITSSISGTSDKIIYAYAIDECTAQELSRYSDESVGCGELVTKRDPESASAVRVASMDYIIPEKAPQPNNVCYLYRMYRGIWGYLSVSLLPYSISSGAVESRDLLLSYLAITLSLHITITLIITTQFSSFNHALNQLTQVLESLVWDRERDVDRLRERFQLTKALMQAVKSEAKYPNRPLVATVRAAVGSETSSSSSSSSSLSSSSESSSSESSESESESTVSVLEESGQSRRKRPLAVLLEYTRASLVHRRGRWEKDEAAADTDVLRLQRAKDQVQVCLKSKSKSKSKIDVQGSFSLYWWCLVSCGVLH